MSDERQKWCEPCKRIREWRHDKCPFCGGPLSGLPPLPEILTHPTAYRVDYALGEHWQYYCRTQWHETAMEIAKPLADKGKIVRITEERYGEKICEVLNAPDPKAA